MNSNRLIPINEINIHDTIDSLNHPLAAYLRSVLARDKGSFSNEMIIDDIENIEVALRSGLSLKSLFLSGINLEVPEFLLKQLPLSAPIYAIAPRTCKKIFEKDKFTRVFAIANIPDTSLHKNIIINTHKDLVILDGISISGNIGAIIRTATALNVGGIIVLNAKPTDIYDRRIIRASRGYIFSVPIATANLNEIIKFCHHNQYQILVTSTHAEKSIDDIAKNPEKMAIVFGSEKTGCTDEFSKHADIQTKIPINSAVESLNVSVAAGIILYMRNHYKNTI